MTKFLFLLLFSNLLIATPLRYEGKGLQITLLSDHTAVAAGTTVTYGLSVTHDPGYHTYWKSPGIVGFPMTLEWDLPEGITASETAYPYPERTMMAIHPCYGYERDVILLSEITIPETFSAETFSADLNLSWMCCAKGCCPDHHTISVSLPVQAQATTSPQHPRIHRSKSELPTPHPQMTASVRSSAAEDVIKVELTLPSDHTPIHLFSEDNQSSSDVVQSFQSTGSQKGFTTYSISLARYEFSPRNQSTFPFVLQTNLGYFTFAPLYPIAQ